MPRTTSRPCDPDELQGNEEGALLRMLLRAARRKSGMADEDHDDEDEDHGGVVAKGLEAFVRERIRRYRDCGISCVAPSAKYLRADSASQRR